jgi:hypothetical protein
VLLCLYAIFGLGGMSAVCENRRMNINLQLQRCRRSGIGYVSMNETGPIVQDTKCEEDNILTIL